MTIAQPRHIAAQWHDFLKARAAVANEYQGLARSASVRARSCSRRGPQSLSDAELLALLLGGSGRRGLDAVAVARELLGRHESLRALLSADSAVVWRPPGLGPAGYCRLQAALELARRHYAEAMRAGPLLDSPGSTRRLSDHAAAR